MGHHWIIDVLADLQAYAQRNGLPALARQLEDTGLLANVEIASLLDEPATRVSGEVIETRRFLERSGAGRRP